jgi:hypothetical protein
MDWTIGVLGFDSRRRLGIFVFITAYRTALGPTQPPVQWVPGSLSLGVKLAGREADHSPPSSAEVKQCVVLYFHSPNTPSESGAQLKHRDSFTLLYHSAHSNPVLIFRLKPSPYPLPLIWSDTPPPPSIPPTPHSGVKYSRQSLPCNLMFTLQVTFLLC